MTYLSGDAGRLLDLRLILESLPAGVWVGKVPGGEAVYANPEFGRILGVPAAEGTGINDAPAAYCLKDRDGQPYPVERLPFSLVVSTGKPARVDDIVVHRPGQDRAYIRAFAYPVSDASGTLTHVVIAFFDIGSEVQAEEQHKTVAARLSFAVNHAPIVLWTANLDGIVTLSEGAGLASLGVAPGQLVGKSLFEIYRDHPKIPGYIRRGLAGESFWYSVSVGDATYDTWLSPIRDSSGAITGITGLSNDVSEVRRLQARAIQDDRTIALGTLAASVSHEINNPLTYILGHLAALRNTVEELDLAIAGLPESVRSCLLPRIQNLRHSLDPVSSGAERIAFITRELRTFSRRDSAGELAVDVHSAIQSVLKLIGKELEARARLNFVPSGSFTVRGHPSRLVQVIFNLVTNAMNALPGDRPDANQIWISVLPEGADIRIEVADNGPGVPPADRERIFEPFVTTRPVGEGTGLGLFVCRNIVRGMGGTLTVLDRPGGGARFQVVLPAMSSPPTGAPLPASPHASTTPPPGCHVLIIDDEPAVSEILSAQLVDSGIRTTVVTDSLRALEMLKSDSSEYDLVYCDLMMKHLTGVELAEALVVSNPEAFGKIVFMTGGAFTTRARDFYDRHLSQCVDKPFDVVSETLSRLARRQRGG